LHTE
jgi:hypothetical protein